MKTAALVPGLARHRTISFILQQAPFRMGLHKSSRGNRARDYLHLLNWGPIGLCRPRSADCGPRHRERAGILCGQHSPL